MLNFNLKGTYQDSAGYTWNFYRDDQLGPAPDPNIFYILPKPQFVLDTANKPIIQFQTYTTSDKNNGSGFCKFQVELSVPPSIQSDISAAILADKTKFPGVSKPNFQSLALYPGSTATIEFQVGSTKMQVTEDASDFGGDTANFLISLSKVQLDSLKSIFNTKGGGPSLTYRIAVPARLQSVSALLTFDSSIAYKYQVTQPTYNGWGDQTSPGSAKGFLTASQSSKFIPTWGIKNPPQTLVDEVTNWANDTIADLVSAEVKDIVATKGLKSSESFNITEVSSFKETFAANTVVKWVIEPKAILPSFPDMNLNMADFEGTINEQVQQMVVTTNLPFTDSKDHGTIKMPDNKGKTIAVKSVTITVHYPTLPQSQSKVTFTSNGSKTFKANYSTSQGSTWSLEYQVNYDSTEVPPISGKIDSITSVQQYLKLEDVGILTVQFDAQQAFNNEFTTPDEVDVAFSYNAADGTSKGITDLLKFKKGDKSLVQSVTSLQPRPISNSYNYQCTYNYNGVTYQAPLVQNKNGFNQIIPAVNKVFPMNIVAFLPASEAANNPLLQATIHMWFADTEKLPKGIKNQPSQASPATYTLNPDPLRNGAVFARDQFDGILIADSPVVYSATIDFAASDQVIIPATQLNNSLTSVLLNQVNRYFTLEVDAQSLAWPSAGVNQVEVLVTFYRVAKGVKTKIDPQEKKTWNSGEKGTAYMTVSFMEGKEEISYDVEVMYPPSTKVYKKTGLTDVIFNVPPKPPTAS